jgi:hypothetical protein
MLSKMEIPESTLHQIDGLVKEIEYQRLDITDSYADEWLRIAFALSDALGEAGRPYFHRVSMFSPKYERRKADAQYSYCLKGSRKGITIRTLFFIAKGYGIDISPKNLLKYRDGQ